MPIVKSELEEALIRLGQPMINPDQSVSLLKSSSIKNQSFLHDAVVGNFDDLDLSIDTGWCSDMSVPRVTFENDTTTPLLNDIRIENHVNTWHLAARVDPQFLGIGTSQTLRLESADKCLSISIRASWTDSREYIPIVIWPNPVVPEQAFRLFAPKWVCGVRYTLHGWTSQIDFNSMHGSIENGEGDTEHCFSGIPKKNGIILRARLQRSNSSQDIFIGRLVQLPSKES